MSTKAIILCAGEGSRWNNYLNSPKHLINIEGERLLDRTVRLLVERGIKDIYIVVKEEDLRYSSKDAKNYVANIDYQENADADKFLSSKGLWNKNGRTLVVYGDCYFTEEAMDLIVNNPSQEWTLFCRPSRSKVTGSKWPECFVQSFYPADLESHELALHRIASLYKNKLISRCGGWEHYRAMIGLPDNLVQSSIMKDKFVEINDWTEDFDYPDDYEAWIKRRKVNAMLSGKMKVNYLLYASLLFEDFRLMFNRVKSKQIRNIKGILNCTVAKKKQHSD